MPYVTLTITNNHGSLPLIVGRTISAVVNHAALVTAGRSRADARDLYIKYNGSTLPVYVVAPNTANSVIYFALQTQIASSGGIDTYRLHFGNLDAVNSIRIPIRDLSQFHPWNSTGDTALIGTPIQPFLFFDSFSHTFESGSWVAYGEGDALDAGVYETDGTWTVNSGNLRHSYAGAPEYARVRMTGSTVPAMLKRITAYFKLTGSPVNPISGPLVFTSGALNGYVSGVGPTDLSAVLGKYTSDVPAVIALSALSPSALNRFVISRVYAVGGNVYADLDGIPLSGADSAFTSGSAGVYDVSAGTGYVEFEWIGVERWDGVIDSLFNVSVGATPSPTLPLILPQTETGIYFPVSRLDMPEYHTSRASVDSDFEGRVITIEYPILTGEEYHDIRALRRSLQGSVGTFTYDSNNYRMVNWSGRQNTASHYSASVTLRKDLS